MRLALDACTRGARRRARMRAGTALLAAVALHGVAAAQALPPPPTFVFWKKEEAKLAEWKAMAQAGLAATTGNSQAISLSLNAAVSRRAGDNKISVEAGGAFARSRVYVASEQDGITGIGPGELRTVDQTATENWAVRTRYDRFFARWNALYGQASVSADPPAGLKLLAGGQFGYRRILFERGKRQLAAELGYDFTHQAYEAGGSPIQIHSGRALVGYHADPDPLLGFDSTLELLTNLNPEFTPTGRIMSLGDNRVTGQMAAMVKLFSSGSVGLRFSAHYTTAPAPRPLAGFSYEPGFVPLADRLDTKSELVLIWRCCDAAPARK